MSRTTPRRGPLGRRLLRATIHVLAVLVAMVTIPLAVGIGWQALAERELRARFPPPGRLVELADGRHIHLREWGIGNRGPTLVLDAAAGLPSSAWALLGEELGRSHHVVAYDRPGMGWSTGLPGPRESTSAMALAEALGVAGIRPPYVAVGHSYGGFSARMFTHLRRDDVVALVLIDATNEDGGGERGFALWYRLAAWRNHMGFNQLVPPGNGFAGLPTDDADAAYAVSLWTSHTDATADELEAWPMSAAQLHEAGDLGELPLLVIAARGSPEHHALQRDLANLSNRATYRELEVWHTSMLFDPEHARLVADEIRRFLAGVD